MREMGGLMWGKIVTKALTPDYLSGYAGAPLCQGYPDTVPFSEILG